MYYWARADRQIAARTALKRKKAHEHSLEQTANQITMLENQIYSIESANINQETLHAMQSAGKAMKDIHGKLDIDKVDRIMYVLLCSPLSHHRLFFLLFLLLTHPFAGRILLNKRRSQTKLVQPLQLARKLASLSTKRSWMPILRSSSRRHWTRKCSKQGQCRFYRVQRMENVSR